ncbi:MAG TPA: CHRD domain-containing protein [Anaeromyxobacteraceae bacterium]|nr:CHRD domain-containing protein [Anaeromyxobacteraceae bacterium]
MTRTLSKLGLAVLLLLPCFGAKAQEFIGRYSGNNEVGALNAESGAILSGGQATVELTLDRGAKTLTFKLTYSGLSSPVTQAHIHFGKMHVPGGIMVFFCSNLPNAPSGTQACPADGGTVSGTLTAADVQAIAGQNVPAGDFDAVINALLSDTAYGNIHTVHFPAGEIRAEIRAREREDGF